MAVYSSARKAWQRARVALDWAEAHTARREPTDLEQARTLLRQASTSFAAMGVPFYSHLANDRLHTLEVESFAQAVAHEKVDRETAAASKIQTGLLPAKPPEIPGWQLAAILVPSRQTSGDFYDFIPLPGSRLGIVIADVADKGAAFFDTDRLLATIPDNQDSSAQEVKDAILGAIRRFAGGVPQFDDMALIVLGRETA